MEIKVPDELRRWIQVPRELLFNERFEPQYLLDGTFTGIKDIPNCKLNPLEHQTKVLEALLDMKFTQELPMKNPNIKFNSSCVVMSDKAGSGKSKSLVAICAIQDEIKNHSININIPIIDPDIRKYYSRPSCIRAMFKKVLSPTLIFASKTVIDQWVTEIQRLTTLKYFTINTVKDLRVLFTLMESDQINDYEIILVKNGECTETFDLPYGLPREACLNRKKPKIYNAIVNASRRAVWNTVIIDDFDVVGLNDSCNAINALFTIIVSATENIATKKVKACNPNFKSTTSALEFYNAPITKLINNRALFELCNIRCSVDYIDQNLPVPSLKYYIHELINPDDRVISAISKSSIEHKQQILEMLNSEEYDGLSKQIGHQVSSAKDLFKIILKDNYNKMVESMQLLKFVTSIDTSKLPKPPKEVEYKYTMEQVRSYVVPSYNCGETNATIKYVKDKYEATVADCKKIVMDMLKEHLNEECSICLESLRNQTPLIMLSCCCKIIHSKCLDSYLNSRVKENLNDSCVLCRDPNNNYYPIPNLDSTDIDSLQFIERMLDPEKQEVQQRTVPLRVAKFEYLLKLIKNEVPKYPKPVKMTFKGVISNDEIQLPDVKKLMKVLVFSNSDKTLIAIENMLKANDLPCSRLQGSNYVISSYKKEFIQAERMVLLINTSFKSAGMNLQCADAVIYAAVNLQSSDILSQSIGRIQRYGRTTRGQVNFITYRNETDELQKYIDKE